MPGVRLNSQDWTLDPATTTRGGTGSASVAADFPSEFLTSESAVADELVARPSGRTDRGAAAAPGALDVAYDISPGETAILAIRHPSGALTFHLPVEAKTRSAAERGQVRFVVTVRSTDGATRTRSAVGHVIKATVIKVAKVAADKAVSLLLPKLAASLERRVWGKRGLQEGWVQVTRDGLAAAASAAAASESALLKPIGPTSSERSLLLLHGPFSNTAAAFKGLASLDFFERVAPLYGDRVYGFDHFSISRTPEENARLLLEKLPEAPGLFDVVAHSRGGLVLRNLVERPSAFGKLSQRFKLGHAVLVATPNDGTPLATPQRWEDTVGWMANLLELFPDNPFTLGAEFVANALVWLARHASGDLPGLHSMDSAGEPIARLQAPPGPPAGAYSALVANYHPTDSVLRRMLDTGVDQFFGSANDLIVPAEAGWRIDRGGTLFIPGTRIGCYGAGGNLGADTVSHVSFFDRPETADFIVAALSGKPQLLKTIDPSKNLPDHRLLRTATIAATAAERQAAAPAPRLRTGGGMSDRPAAVADTVEPSAEPPLRIVVVNGDLTFEQAPLLLGHYRATRLMGTEKVMNTVLDDAMNRSLRLGVYPLMPGTHQVFVNTRSDPESPRRLPRPQAVIVVGLGDEGKLRLPDLSLSIQLAVIAWAQRMAESPAATREPLTVGATLLGSGGTGVSAGQAAQAIAQGVYEANSLLREVSRDRPLPVVGTLRLIELYLDRASDAWRALKMQADVTPGRYEISPIVEAGVGALPRALDSGYRGADYDFITALTQELPNGDTEIAYTLDTKRARTEVRAHRTQGRLLRDLIATASNDRNTDPQIGSTLFKLLIPVEMEPFLAGTGEMQIELDGGTAGIPWELLDTDTGHGNGDHQRPWAIRAKLLRKLRTTSFRAQVTDAGSDSSVLVIGEPECPPAYPRLAGARHESRAVCSSLTQPGGLDEHRVQALISDDTGPGPDARTVITALFERDWRIVHIAGHGALPSAPSDPGGVVLSNGTFLGPREIHTMRVVPELVFVNCCHLGARDAAQTLTPDDRSAPTAAIDRSLFAAGIAEELIRIGVRCVIAAGWAVDDDAASAFATTFYDSLMRGSRFIDAVAEARNAAYDLEGNTWAAYQCYGDPDWTFRRETGDAQQPSVARVDEFAGVASPLALKLALDTIVIQTKFQKRSPAVQLERVRALDSKFSDVWGGIGSIAEGFGGAYVAGRDVPTAVSWYERALAANDGSASLAAAEQLANLRVRLAWERVVKAQTEATAAEQPPAPGRRQQKTRHRDTAGAARETQRTLRDAVSAARKTVGEAIALLETLVAVQATQERESLYGSAFKRLALIESAAGRAEEERRAISGMRDHYQRAQAIGTAASAANLFYPALNYMAAELVLNGGRPGWKGFDAELLEATERSLEAKCVSDPDFWSVVGQTELRVYRALAARKLVTDLRAIEGEFDDLYQRVSAPWMWASVADNARFVMLKYAAKVKSPAERKAVAAVLTKLATWSQS